MARPQTQHSTERDPVKVDSRHYKVELENDRVRVLRIKYGAKEKSVMHEHPAALIVCLTDFSSRFTMPDGTTQERHGKAGETMWAPAETHLPENLTDKNMELLLIEMKGSGSGG